VNYQLCCYIPEDSTLDYSSRSSPFHNNVFLVLRIHMYNNNNNNNNNNIIDIRPTEEEEEEMGEACSTNGGEEERV
jgi:hypothetical protein